MKCWLDQQLGETLRHQNYPPTGKWRFSFRVDCVQAGSDRFRTDNSGMKTGWYWFDFTELFHPLCLLPKLSQLSSPECFLRTVRLGAVFCSEGICWLHFERQFHTRKRNTPFDLKLQSSQNPAKVLLHLPTCSAPRILHDYHYMHPITVFSKDNVPAGTSNNGYQAPRTKDWV